jgi:succinate-acetate transporter protein
MENQNVKISNADPSALGLFGLAMVTLVASSIKLGWTSGVSLAIPWVIFLGASAQLFACINDSKRMNTFGTTAFGAYAFFWYSIAMTWLIQS